MVMTMYSIVSEKVRRHRPTPARNIHGFFHQNADIHCMQGRRIIDAVSKTIDSVAGTLKCANDPLLLLRIDLNNKVRTRGKIPHGFIPKRRQLFAGEHRFSVEADGIPQMCCYIAVVSADHFDLDAKLTEVADDPLVVSFGRVVEIEKVAKSHLPSVVPVIAGRGSNSSAGNGEDAESLVAFGLE